ncbi:MAG: hypothetical protein M3511_00960 [Deinococcota bacterium]|nr:hypothetical protein [Deinococcota bacterium]
MRPYVSLVLSLALVSLALFMTSCAPVLADDRPPANGRPADSPQLQEVERAAVLAWHRMEASYLETGRYSTAALRGLDLPRGTMWNLEHIEERDYLLRFSSTAVEGMTWEVSPRGVTRSRA